MGMGFADWMDFLSGAYTGAEIRDRPWNKPPKGGLSMSDPSVPVTNHDFTPEACAERLEGLLGAPALAITASGGGIPNIETLSFDQFVLVHRDEVANAVRFLRRADTPAEVEACPNDG